MNVLKILFNPIFLIAAGLHAGLLLLPIAGGSSEKIVPAPDPQGESITVTHIPLQKKSTDRDKEASGEQPQKKGQPPKTDNQKPSSGTGSNDSGRGNNAGSRQRPRNIDQELGRLPANRSNPPNLSTPSNSRQQSSPSRPSNNPPSEARNTAPDLPQLLPSEKRQTLLARLLNQKDGVRQVPTDFLNWLIGFNRRYRYSDRGTTDAAVDMAKVNWLTTLDTQAGLTVSASPAPLTTPLTISYPLTVDTARGPLALRRCLTPLPEEGLLGLIVDAEGGVVFESPTLLRSLGYPLLDELALNAVKGYGDFPEAASPQAHTVKVTVDYDENACVSLTKLGIPPVETAADSNETPTPPSGSRNPLEEAEGEPNPFAK